MYSSVFTDHLTNPRNVGELADANARAEETNPVCGDRLRLYLRVRDARIEAAQFLAYGCPPTLACGSALTEMLRGCSLAGARGITRKHLIEAVGGLPSRKQHAAALAIETLKAALKSSSLWESDSRQDSL
ncbi:MAG: iron-sulfur cluster assembly scaffold protein [Pyrinomonadaceae bacterium]